MFEPKMHVIHEAELHRGKEEKHQNWSSNAADNGEKKIIREKHRIIPHDCGRTWEIQLQPGLLPSSGLGSWDIPLW